MLNLRRNPLSCSYFAAALLVVANAPTSLVKASGPSEESHQVVPIDDQNLPCDDLCGWVEQGSCNTTPATARPGKDACRPSSAIDHAMAEKSASVLRTFQRWWDASGTRGDSEPSTSDVIVFDFLRIETQWQGTPDPISLQQSMDPATFARSWALEELERLQEIALDECFAVTRTDNLVGCSPMCFTVEESYMAYDMSDRDTKLWAVLPSVNRPLCIRVRGGEFDVTSIWIQFDSAVRLHREPAIESTPVELDCTPDSLLDRCVKRWRVVNDAYDGLVRSVEAQAIGRRIAKLVDERERLARRVAAALAETWPKVDREPAPSPTGAALLARAGAITSESQDANEIATIPHERVSALPQLLSDSSHR